MIQAINWNKKHDEYTNIFFEQNQNQYWRETEFSMNRDIDSYQGMTDKEIDIFKKVFAGLTFLDSNQAAEGMPLISMHIQDGHQKAVLSWMAFMEHVHAKSYSYIFTSLLSNTDIDNLFKWAEENPLLQEKGQLINTHYMKLFKPEVTELELYKSLIASVALENIQFYSGFFFPLWLGGRGRMRASSEIITKIMQDESIHGQFVGILAQESFMRLPAEQRAEALAFQSALFEEVYQTELRYTDDIYGNHMVEDDGKLVPIAELVKKFIRYNINKACANVGVPAKFEEEEINSIVEAGLKTTGGTHDFFSTKSKNYVMPTENIRDVVDKNFATDERAEEILSFLRRK